MIRPDNGAPCARRSASWIALSRGRAALMARRLHWVVLMTSITRSSLIILWLCLGGCSPSLLPCSNASWVDRVEDDWLVVNTWTGESQTLRRLPQRAHWREGDAILGDRVERSCRNRLIAEVQALRRALTP